MNAYDMPSSIPDSARSATNVVPDESAARAGRSQHLVSPHGGKTLLPPSVFCRERFRLIHGSVRLSERRQPYLAPRKPGARQDRLICRKTRLTAEPLDLSMARQAYPPPVNVIGKLDKLVGGKTTLSASRTRLSAAR